ncbi:MAG: UDP-N-acetylmuramoyl-L-alanine--D-glutamate ligase, partial [Acidimicrobiia bacterium]|nr:UDP-N-acetylmuramoyl-L-alanine--D-glutamate ligase [Acidimicrobiia bacterium]
MTVSSTGSGTLVVGFGVTGQAVAAALVRRGLPVVAVDDRSSDALRAAAAEMGVVLHEPDGTAALGDLVVAAAEVHPAPGLAHHHPVFALAAAAGVPVRSELDLAARFDTRPIVAVTGTDGKTTVTVLAAAVLEASGVRAVVAGNNDVPLVRAIDDAAAEVFVVEASSFRLERTERFTPAAACWLNLAPDHLDVHADLVAYEAAKARIWRDLGPEATAVGNAEDPIVVRHLASAGAGTRWTFSATAGAGTDWRVEREHLVGPGWGAFVPVADLPRQFDHDLANTLAAAAVAAPVGATAAGAATAARAFRGLPHRLALVADAGGVRWYDDSKATTPNATVNDVAAVAAVGRPVVLVAGGRSKGVDLATLGVLAPAVRAVVAI